MRRCLVTLALFAAMPAHAQETLPQVDPRAPESCDVTDGWIVVMKDWISARSRAEDAGALSPAVARNLAAWFDGAEDRILAGEDVKALCREAVAHRAANGF